MPDSAESRKRACGRYFTAVSPFAHDAFRIWSAQASLPDEIVLEPFAGNNSIIRHLQAIGLCRRFISFDIRPADPAVAKRDTLTSFPLGFRGCVTNPPWLAKNSATARGLPDRQCKKAARLAVNCARSKRKSVSLFAIASCS